MFGLEIIDIVAIALYFAVVLYIGFRAMKRIKNQEDYFLGGRNFGRWIQTFALLRLQLQDLTRHLRPRHCRNYQVLLHLSRGRKYQLLAYPR